MQQRITKKLIYINNWKMNLSHDQEIKFASTYYDKFILLTEKFDITMVICPSFTTLNILSAMFKNTKIQICAQNCSSHLKGSFTGQICAESLNQIGCQYCIIGHSESRKEFKENNIQIAQKFVNLINNNISPIICIGETIEEHSKNKVLDFLEKELSEIFKLIKEQIEIPNYLSTYIAYEPIWAIGTGNTPKIDQLETIFTWLHDKTINVAPNANWKLIYGGSVSSKIIADFKKIDLLDGFLIGGASLNFQELEKIVHL